MATSSGRPDHTASLFHRIRWRLTLWYSGVLAAALILFSVALYLILSHLLLDPVTSDLSNRAQALASSWPAVTGIPCAPPDYAEHGNLFFACYDPGGHVIMTSRFAAIMPHFIDPSLAKAAIQQGSSTQIVDTHSQVGAIQSYAVRVQDPNGQVLGAIQVGTPVGGEVSTLEILRRLLLVMIGATLLLAAVGGLFLANRALLPLRLAYRRQRDFIADASHELRTPLTLLRADAEVLLRSRDRLTDDDVALLEDMVAETSHMASLADSMLSLARLDAGRAQLESDVIDLSELAAGVVHRVVPLAAERNIAVRTQTGSPVLMVGDRVLLEQTVLILVDNAIKYNRPGGEVAIRTATEGNEAVLEVRDTGIGIAAEHLPHLGERFYRVDKARSREAGGAGLGVSIAQSIAARHGGSLQYISEPGHGTTARLALPAAGSPARQAVPAPTEEASKSA